MKLEKILLISTLSLTLTGCGGGNKKETTTATKENTKVESVKQEKKEVVKEEPKQEVDNKAILPEYALSEAKKSGLFTDYVISEKAKTFLNQNFNIFPSTQEQYGQFLDKNLAFKHADKDITSVGDKLMLVKGTVLSIQTTDVDRFGKMTEFQLSDDDFNVYYVMFYGELPDIFKNDYIAFVGLPYGQVVFPNVSGGTTKALFVVANSAGK